jgi:hypothetical protein
MRVYSLVTRRPGREEVVWSGLYFVQALGSHDYIVGKCVCFYANEVENYPLYEPYSVGERTGRYIELSHLQRNGTLLSDDGEELKYVSADGKVRA